MVYCRGVAKRCHAFSIAVPRSIPPTERSHGYKLLLKEGGLTRQRRTIGPRALRLQTSQFETLFFFRMSIVHPFSVLNS